MVLIGLLAGFVAPRYFAQVGKSQVKVGARRSTRSTRRSTRPARRWALSDERGAAGARREPSSELN